MTKKLNGRNGLKLAAAGVVLVAAVTGGAYLKISHGRNAIRVPAYVAERVIDGDTFETKEKQSIRLASADAPELKYCGGIEAKAELEKLVMGKPLYIKAIYRDGFQRLIAYVWSGAEFVNKRMVEEGKAVYRLTEKANSETEMMHQAANKARESKAGVYGRECTQITNTENPKCVIKGNRRPASGADYYHYPGCGQYNNTVVQLYMGDQWFCTETEARAAGFKKGPLCP